MRTPSDLGEGARRYRKNIYRYLCFEFEIKKNTIGLEGEVRRGGDSLASGVQLRCRGVPGNASPSRIADQPPKVLPEPSGRTSQ